MSGEQPSAVFRVARTAYIIVPFLAVGLWPIALYGGDTESKVFHQDTAAYASGAQVSWLTLLFLIPVVVAYFIARVATFVDADGITVRALFGRKHLNWDEVRGLSVSKRAVYAVTRDGAVRLPCVGVPQLGAVARASGGRLPEVADPTPKYAPQRRRRR